MPYVLNSEKEIGQMLKDIGVSSVEELYSHLPQAVRLTSSLDVGLGLSEMEVRDALGGLAAKNKTISEFNSFLGAGCYDHYVPAALPFILSLGQFLTAYTPYQAECSQGILQAIYEYQSYMCLLTGMDVSNASLLDGASSLAEAVLMSLRITNRKKILVSEALHPEYRETLNTYLSGFNASGSSSAGFSIYEIAAKDGKIDPETVGYSVDNNTACCVFQNPNFFGLIEDVQNISKAAHAKGALSIMSANPIALALLKEPAKLGVDIACGDGQPLGAGSNLGGSSFGFLAVKKEYMRQLPGRIVGKTLDKDGKDAYCLTMQTREQHIRRQKATSNICSNQSLNAIGSAIYLSLVGREGLRDAARFSFCNTKYLYNRMAEIRGVRIPFASTFFNEFLWETDNAKDVLSKLRNKGIIAGFYLGDKFPQYKNGILSCCTEKKTKQQIDDLVNTLAEVLHG
ncbi:MAG: aminomethyl-transferring glycine dehydrogenase subunit GcvPA [Candidatus Omnitrophica bacterium]|nr:aminomethyl-transferring glycine dehydrogenase subunit GcvPA [Candidatus Omnitrophota bacterium]